MWKEVQRHYPELYEYLNGQFIQKLLHQRKLPAIRISILQFTICPKFPSELQSTVWVYWNRILLTTASDWSHWSSQTVPHSPSYCISSLPSLGPAPPTNLIGYWLWVWSSGVGKLLKWMSVYIATSIVCCGPIENLILKGLSLSFQKIIKLPLLDQRN